MKHAEMDPALRGRANSSSSAARGKLNLKRELTTLISRKTGEGATANPLADDDSRDGAVSVSIPEMHLDHNNVRQKHKTLFVRQLVKLKTLVVGSSDKEVDENAMERCCNAVLCRPKIALEDNMGLS